MPRSNPDLRKAILYLALGFLVGRAARVPVFLPLGLSYLVAAKMACPRLKRTALVGVLCGYAVLGDFGVFMVSAALLAALSVIAGRSRTASYAAAASAAFVQLLSAASLGSRVIPMRDYNVGYLVLVGLVESLVGLGSAVGFTAGLKSFREGRRRHGDDAPGRSPWGVSVDYLLSAGFLAGAAIAGLGGVTLGRLQVDLQSAAARFIVIGSSYWGGPGLGAACGILAGAFTSLSALAEPEFLAVYGLCGLGAGAASKAGRLATASGFLASASLAAFVFQTPQELSWAVGESVLAAGVFLAIPSRHWKAIDEVAKGLLPTAEHMEAATADPAGDDPAPDSEHDHPGDGLCALAAILQDSSSRLADPDWDAFGRHDEGAFTAILRQVASIPCRGCDGFARCWQEGLYMTSRRALNLVASLWASEGRVPLKLKAHEVAWCQRPEALMSILTGLVTAYSIDRHWRKRNKELRRAVSSHMREIAESALQLSRCVPASPKPEAVKLTYEVGVAEQPARGDASGDGYLAKEVSPGRLALMLSDGMGTGAKAARQTDAVMGLMELMLSAGLPLGNSAALVNGILSTRPDGDCLAAVDVVAVDLHSGMSQFLKAGTPPTFLRRLGDVKTFTGDWLPMGILEEFQAPVFQQRLMTGDALVMVTDGVLGPPKAWAKDSEERIRSILLADSAKTSAEEAERVLREMAAHKHSSREDDMTVMVTFFA